MRSHKYQTITETWRRCASCHKRLPVGSRGIELGIDCTGTMYLCSARCCDAYNKGWR